MAEPKEEVDLLDELPDLYEQKLEDRMIAPRLTTDEKMSQRAHARVASLMRAAGLESIDKDSPQGKAIQTRAQGYIDMADPALPDDMKMRLVFMAVEIELLKNAAFTWLSKIKRPKETTGDKAAAYRQEYGLASGAYKGYIQLLLSVLRMLRGDGVKEKEIGTLEKKLLTMTKK